MNQIEIPIILEEFLKTYENLFDASRIYSDSAEDVINYLRSTPERGVEFRKRY